LYADGKPRLLGYRSDLKLRRFRLRLRSSPTCRPPTFEGRVHSPTSQASSSESVRPAIVSLSTNLSRRIVRVEESASMGCQFPLRDIGVRRPLTARNSQLLATVRPRRSSRPRRFSPPHTLRACSIPQPRTGFSLQGFNATAEPCRVLPDRCPPAVSTNAPMTRRSLQCGDARLQGLAPYDARDGLR